MREFETEIYTTITPFGTSLFSRSTEPKDQSFIEMARYTFFPYFEAYTFCFFWVIVLTVLFVISLTYQDNGNYSQNYTDPQFLRINQTALFNLGENYPYFILKKLQYYRVLMSMMLFRNFYHYAVVCIGIVTVGSYVEKILGFKKCFVFAIIAGVSGIFLNNIIHDNATLESATPLLGLIGYCFGLLFKKNRQEWKFFMQQKINMVLILSLMLTGYLFLSFIYTNINTLPMVASFIVGIFLIFTDPQETNSKILRVLALLLILGGLSLIIIIFFFRTNPRLLPSQ